MNKAPDKKGLPKFVSIFTPEGEAEVLTEGNILLQKDDGGEIAKAEGTSIITVAPGQHLVTHAGRCVCADGELRCSRPGK